MKLKTEISRLNRKIKILERIIHNNTYISGKSGFKDIDQRILAIQKIVSSVSGISLCKIIGAGRRSTEKISDVRMLAMLLCCEFEIASRREIASHFTLRDHTTVIHAERRFRILMDNDMELRSLYQKSYSEVAMLLGIVEQTDPEYMI